MNTEYRREMNRNYLILSGEDMPESGSYPMRILEENRIPGILPCSVREIDGQPYLYYDITSRQSLRLILDMGQLDRNLLFLLFSSFADALDALAEYLLWDDCVLAGPELVFADSERKEFLFAVCPGRKSSFSEQIRELAESLLPKLPHEDAEAVNMGYSFYQLCMEGDPDAETFRKIAAPVKNREKERASAEEPFPGEKEEDDDREKLMDSLFGDPEEEEETFFRKIRRWLFGEGEETNKGKTENPSVLSGAVAEPPGAYGTEEKKERLPEEEPHPGLLPAEGSGEDACATGLLTAADMAAFVIKEKARMIPEDADLPPLILTGGSAIVGKSARDADYVIDSPVVSRLHARLMWDGTRYRLMDLNSRNGTFVNGDRMRINEVRELKDKDTVRFADTAYEFRMK